MVLLMRIKPSSRLPSMVFTGGTLIISALLALSPAQESQTHASVVETACATELDTSMSIGMPVIGSAGALGGSNASWIITIKPLSESCRSKISKIALTSEGSLVNASDGVPLNAEEGSPSFFEVRSHASGTPKSRIANRFQCSNKTSDLEVVVLGGGEEIVRKKLWLRELSAPTLPGCQLSSETSLNVID